MNPGSDEAVDRGCNCPREEKRGSEFVMCFDCPLHAPPEDMVCKKCGTTAYSIDNNDGYFTYFCVVCVKRGQT